MKKSIITYSILVAIVFFVSQTTFAQYSKWEKDVSYFGIEFKKIRFRIEDTDTMYVEGFLKQQTIINDYACHKRVLLSKKCELISFILSDKDTIAGNIFKKETQVTFQKKGGFHFYCLYNPVIQGYQCKGTNYKKLFFMGSTGLQLYSSGKLKYFQPVDDIEIQGVFCKPSPVRGGIYLYENGKLKECTSAKEQIIQNEMVEKNFTLKFDEDGTLTYSKNEKIFGK